MSPGTTPEGLLRASRKGSDASSAALDAALRALGAHPSLLEPPLPPAPKAEKGTLAGGLLSDASDTGMLKLCSNNCGKPGRKVCGGCGVARYCSEECQLVDWTERGHRAVCKKLALGLAAIVAEKGSGGGGNGGANGGGSGGGDVGSSSSSSSQAGGEKKEKGNGKKPAPPNSRRRY